MSVGGATWPAPAKLNLMLRIVGRRDDGYHRLQSVFQFVDLEDRLSFALREDPEIRRVNAIGDVAEEDDLAVRAARLLKRHCGVPGGVDITLDKCLPMGAGLGGGSSDAATTLVVMNRLWGCGLDREALGELGLTLGADVPVFVQGQAAWAEGVGEQLTEVNLPEPVYLLLVPDCHVSTREVFQDPELTRNSPPKTIRDFLAGERGNDCLAVVKKRYPQVAAAFDWLVDSGLSAQLTGTGACVFAECDDEKQASALKASVPSSITSYVVRGRNKSQLYDALARY